MPPKATPIPLPSKVQRVLRKEFTDFFTHMRSPEPGWPAIPEQAFIDALADSLVGMAERESKSPVAYLQTLVHELQDRANTYTKG